MGRRVLKKPRSFLEGAVQGAAQAHAVGGAIYIAIGSLLWHSLVVVAGVVLLAAGVAILLVSSETVDDD